MERSVALQKLIALRNELKLTDFESRLVATFVLSKLSEIIGELRKYEERA